MNQSDIDLGQFLVEKELISRKDLESAIKTAQESGVPLESVILSAGFLHNEKQVLPLMADFLNVGHVDLKSMSIADDIRRKIPAKFVSHYKIIPFAIENGNLCVATTRPFDYQMMDEIGMVVDLNLKPSLAAEKDILEAIRRYYGVGAETIEQMMGTVQPKQQAAKLIDNIDESNAEVSISRFLNQILLEAYKDRATDIHIEPFEDELQIRYRVDGILHDAKVPPNIKHFQDAISSRIKILSNLNIAEKRTPQDGRFKVKVSNVDLDLRVSFLPTPYGESVVMRLLNTSNLYSLEDLGLGKKELYILEEMIKKPHGIIFITGPTGSGKTTTLYSCLSRINTEDKKVITIEDPIEYQLKGITQIQVNPIIGLNFAAGLRSMLRHDPDIMMVGEVRDIETAEISIQVALTGHLIFSTLHTNDAAGGVARLVDMGVEPYLITSTIECFIAQRLVRTICPDCKAPKDVDAKIVKDFEVAAPEGQAIQIFEG
ncbi:MAG: Flp pilus assembly complex ATPase component TadA, partial [Candidatus Omnitrophica bacterium]|nr:Flp pilus assembly complex ATPase component TadA [Candidatus Omnitrophota bacterium]